MKIILEPDDSGYCAHDPKKVAVYLNDVLVESPIVYADEAAGVVKVLDLDEQKQCRMVRQTFQGKERDVRKVGELKGKVRIELL